MLVRWLCVVFGLLPSLPALPLTRQSTELSLQDRRAFNFEKIAKAQYLFQHNISVAKASRSDGSRIWVWREGNMSLKDLVARTASLVDRPKKTATQNTPFAKVSPGDTAVAVEIEIATPTTIVSVYLLMYVPLGMVWAYYFHLGSQEKHYMLLIPVTLCSFIIGLDLVNQSLSALMEAPMGLTAIQSLIMFVFTGLWTLGMHVHALLVKKSSPGEQEEDSLYPLSASVCFPVLWKWSPAALWFVAYQLINHEVSFLCSLSERTVFLNLSPVFGLFLEPLVMPSRVGKLLEQTFAAKMALFTMAFGAILFSIQYSDFTATGLEMSGLMVAVLIPYRLLQRVLLIDCQEVPTSLLCSFDGFVLAAPAVVACWWSGTGLVESFAVWIHNPSIMIMLTLSMFTFTGSHLAVLYTLKVASATSTMVFNNIASFVVVFEGIFFFGDPVMQAPLVVIGILLSLWGGMWYAIEQQPSPCLDCCPDSPSSAKDGTGTMSLATEKT